MKGSILNQSFHHQGLLQVLKRFTRPPLTGVWHIHQEPETNPQLGSLSASLKATPIKSNSLVWKLVICNGCLVFSGTQPLSWVRLFKVLQNYTTELRDEAIATQVLNWEQDITRTRGDAPYPRQLLERLQNAGFVSTEQTHQALRLHLLNELDEHLWQGEGQAEFFVDLEMANRAPMPGYSLQNLLEESEKRHFLWKQLRRIIPSPDYIPCINVQALNQSQLSATQRRRLEKIASGNRSFRAIALALATDPLEIARFFAHFISSGVVTVESPEAHLATAKTTPASPHTSTAPSTATSAPTSAPTKNQANQHTPIPEVCIIDDSPEILKQFHALVARWGYRINAIQNATQAIPNLLQGQPSIIFIDVNMPNICGFDLVKQIRSQPQLEGIPLVLLSAEKKLSHKWQAKWSGCHFLYKPTAVAEVEAFQSALKHLLLTMNSLSDQVSPIPQAPPPAAVAANA